MDIAPGLGSRLIAGVALVPASVVAVLAFGSLSGPAGPASTTPADASSPVAVAVDDGEGGTGRHVLVRGPHGPASVILDDSAAARAFAAMLPLRLTLRDPMGQAKSGQLPSPIDITGSKPIAHASVGSLYYWAPTHTVAIFYDDLGQTVPRPGLVRLGVVNRGLTSISTAGNRFPITIEAPDPTLTARES